MRGQPLSCPLLFNDGNLGVTHGPLSTADELWDVLAKFNNFRYLGAQGFRQNIPELVGCAQWAMCDAKVTNR
jgi:hypothetical protein